MKFNAEQIASFLEGEVIGDAHVEIDKIAEIEKAEKGCIAFLYNLKYASCVYSSKASVIVTDKNFIPDKGTATTFIKVKEPYNAFKALIEWYQKHNKESKVGIEQPSFISSTANLGEEVYVGAFSHIGEQVTLERKVKIYPQCFIGDNVHIGVGTFIYPGVKIYRDTFIGKNCLIHAGSVIGSDGFGFVPAADGYHKIPHMGNVVIEDNVEVGACCTIDRATFKNTRICSGVKLDNQIQIAHNVEIGPHTAIAAQSGIAGSAKIGRNVMIGGQVGITGHLEIADEVKIAAQSGIGKNLTKGAVVQGSPAFSLAEYKKSYIYFRRLAELANRIAILEKKLNLK
ncbi:UDP-3-O-(3-hydroxymyristoyl)glucosamine N-acyltransferase [Bacteroidetes bacterium endosymbiont of Geopemphigus sp.]|uniref:UDP-3-O-(3-hydroxymyristoyl)glucosamine N-acyltransferase n=1 Tax=Bacteroidetes bacterium endosymbiont of Geopemphigus sp. TaxID=2047937 RepID=UPI000CD1983A|nr:UDP-3-O-(3-hydroxymyristoyl)glucosamine N-acyltransferase [Bacteroidetes bacterium endosymbiont of Geopemphigus sp.]